MSVRVKGGQNYLKKENGKYKHPKFAKAIKKYGWESFQTEILHEVNSLEEAILLEEIEIKNYNSVENGYNSTPGGKYVYNSSRKVDMIDPNTEEILKTFQSATEASKFVSLKTNTNIIRCCKGLAETAGAIDGKRVSWRYSNETDEEKTFRINNREFLRSKNKERLKNILNYTAKSVKMFYTNNPENILKIFNSATEAAYFIGLKNAAHIIECCKGKRNYAGKYNSQKVSWSYVKDNSVEVNENKYKRIIKNKEKYQKINNQTHNRKVIGIRKFDNSEFIFNSIKDAAHFVGLKNPTTITAVIKGRQKSSAGYEWRLYD